MKSVPIPGEILRTDVFLGLTFDELVVLGAVPIVVVLPTLYIEQVPLVATLAMIALTTVAVALVVVRTPEGQTPTEWAPNALKRRVMPATFYLKPKEPPRATAHYMDQVQTAHLITAETSTDEDVDLRSDADDDGASDLELDSIFESPETTAPPEDSADPSSEHDSDSERDPGETEPPVATDGGVDGRAADADDEADEGPTEDGEASTSADTAFEGVIPQSDDGSRPSSAIDGADATAPPAQDGEQLDPAAADDGVERPTTSGGDAEGLPSANDDAADSDAEQTDSEAGEFDDVEELATSTVHESATADAAADDVVRSSPDDAHRTVRRSPQSTDETEQSAFSIPNYAQDLVDVEFVLESGDEYVPSGVDGAGMIVVEEDSYVGVARVQARTWSIHTDRKKSEIISGYKAGFLSTLDFPVQIVSYPTTFDISDHLDRLEEVDHSGSNERDSDLVTIGRQLYPDWLDEFIASNDMKQRQFYVVVPLTADQLSQFQSGKEGLAATVAERAPPLEPLLDVIAGDDDDVQVSRQQCLRELDGRLRRIANGLRRLDVSVERLDDRDEVLGVLYHYYNNEQPVSDAFPTGPYSVRDADAPTPASGDAGGE